VYPSLQSILLLAPEIILVIMATWIIVFGAFVQNRWAWSVIASASYFVAAFALYCMSFTEGCPFWEQYYVIGTSHITGLMEFDALGFVFRWLALLMGLLFTALGSGIATKNIASETFGTLMLMTVGLMLVGSANDLVFLFLGLELVSIPTYVLLFLGRRDQNSAEASVKYFFLSIVSSAILLYGFSFMYGMGGTTLINGSMGIRESILGSAESDMISILAPVTLVLLFAGLGFKIAAVPFHFYAPDVYQGTTNANAGLLAVMPKIAGIVALVRIVSILLPAVGEFAWQISIALAVLTMTIGNVCALWQSNFRRMMAYSSIAHAGYMLIGLAAGFSTAESGGIGAAVLYLLVYAFASLASFAALAYLGSESREINEIDELAGLGRKRPLIATVIAVSMFSLAGIPPLAGFWGKFSLFFSAINVATQGATETSTKWFVILAVAGALNAAVAAAYYLRIVAVMFFRPTESDLPAKGGLGALGVTCVCTIVVLLIGVMPGPANYLAELADRANQNQLNVAKSEKLSSTVTLPTRSESR